MSAGETEHEYYVRAEQPQTAAVGGPVIDCEHEYLIAAVAGDVDYDDTSYAAAVDAAENEPSAADDVAAVGDGNDLNSVASENPGPLEDSLVVDSTSLSCSHYY